MNKILNFIDLIIDSKLWNFLKILQRIIMLWTSIIMLTILGIVVVARYLFHADIFGYDEIVLIDSFWMYFIGASYAMYEEAHVKADILARMFSKHIQMLMKVLAGIVQTVINIIFNIFAFNMILRSIETWPVTSSWNIPFLFPQMSILIGFTLMSFYLAIYTFRDLGLYVRFVKEGNI